jgi:16S rRNA (cytosine967-C5)-methyltransferase
MAAVFPKAINLARALSKDMADAALQIAAIMSRDPAELALRTKETPVSPAISDLVYRGLRCWGLAQVRLARMAKKEPDLAIRSLLAIAWAALQEKIREPYIVLDQTAEAAKQIAGPKVAGFVNALLRNTERDPSAARDVEQPVAKWNAPDWWIEKIQDDWGLQSQAVLDALRTRAPLTVRLAAGLEGQPQAYLDQLRSCGLQGRILGPAAVSIEPPVSVDRIPGFSSGQVSVQDASAQAVVGLFDDVVAQCLASNARPELLDACAAPGGKAIAMAQHYEATIWALDNSPARLARLRADLPRVSSTLKGEVRPVLGDALTPDRWPRPCPALFDAILLDAPCSASGVSRRHPEIPWKRRPEEIHVVADIQRKMLDVLWSRLKPGGELAFVTCSVFLEEGEAQVQSFLDRTSDASALPSPGRLLPIASPETGRNQDGFFFAKFKKNSGLAGNPVAHGSYVPGTTPRAGQ